MIERQDAANFSTLKHLLKSPLHYLEALRRPEEDTDALRLGRAIHCRAYEPDRWFAEFVVEPHFHRGMLDVNARAKGFDGGKEAAREWDLSHVGVETITREMYESVEGMNAALKANPLTAGYIVGGRSEVPIEWLDEQTGIRCRARVDHLNGCLSDLKSCANIEPRAVARSIGAFLYHFQLGMYATGLEAIGEVLTEPPALIFVESCRPHDTLVLEFSEAELAKGRSIFRTCLDRLAECRRTGLFHGVAGGKKQPVKIPEWAAPDEDVSLVIDGELVNF